MLEIWIYIFGGLWTVHFWIVVIYDAILNDIIYFHFISSNHKKFIPSTKIH